LKNIDPNLSHFKKSKTNNEGDKIFIVFKPNAIIQPDAMVVKNACASTEF
jgi:hypothetical protein